MKSVHTDRYSLFLRELVSARKRAGLTQQDLASRLGRPQSYVSKYEQGERRLDVIEFLDIAHIISLDPGEVIHGLEGNEKQTMDGRVL